jgi:hypothetical protein
MNSTEEKLLNLLRTSSEKASVLIQKIIADHAAEVAGLKAKLNILETAELKESEKPAYQVDMKDNLIRILYDRFQIAKPKRRKGKIQPNRLAILMHCTKQTLYNAQNGTSGDITRRAYHAIMLMAQKLSNKDMRDVVRDLNTYDYD